MLKVGLTGGIASGKSTVARIFRDLGAHVIDADEIAREIVIPGSPALARIVSAFGPEVLGADGGLDRGRLGAIVFADPAKRRRLEDLLHPPILGEIDHRVAEHARRDPHGIVVVDAALIFEVGRQRDYDLVVVVWAGEEQQLQRLQERDALGPEEARRRLAAQMPLEEKRRMAHAVVDNSGSREACRAEAERVFRELQRDARGRG